MRLTDLLVGVARRRTRLNSEPEAAYRPALPFSRQRPPRLHERQIAALFQGDVVFTSSKPVLDNPLLILAFTNRSGSNLVADYLSQTGMVSRPTENLNHDGVRRQKERHGDRSFPDYVARLVAEKAHPGEFFGIKASAEQLEFLIRWGILRMFPSVHVLHVQRDDLVAQAVSHWIAHQTGQWISNQPTGSHPPRFDAAMIEGIMTDVLEQNAAIRLTCATLGQLYISVSYEEVVHDPQAAIRRTMDFLGIELVNWPVLVPRIEKQATAINNEFADRLYALWAQATP